jgi:mannose-1-phosphate guanylyltransferase
MKAGFHDIAGADASYRRVALLLAGGDGVRLRDLTREIAGIPIPKQYCRILHGTSLLEAAISRTQLLFSKERISVVINQDHLDFAKDQVKGLPASNIFMQPANRDTGPGIMFALKLLERVYGDAMVAVFPTDHYIDQNWMFIAHVARAMNAISFAEDKIALLGVSPDRIETGYGYIVPENPLKISGNIYKVLAFAEKPAAVEAGDLIARGALWNTLVMVFKLSKMLDLVRDVMPEEMTELCDLLGSPNGVEESYHSLRPWNFSTSVLSRIPEHLIVLRVANVLWSDWGTRESVERTCRTLNLAPSWEMARAMGDHIGKPAEESRLRHSRTEKR